VRIGYGAGFRDGLAAGIEADGKNLERQERHFERTLAILREENSTLRRLFELTTNRADNLAGELARSLVVGAFGPDARRPTMAVPHPPTSRDPINGLGNVLDPVPFDDPRGQFKSEAEASLLFPGTNGDAAAEG